MTFCCLSSPLGNQFFSSPVRKYCSHPGVGVRARVAQMLKFLIKVFISLYLLNMWMDQVDTLHGGRYWSEVLCCTIMTHLGDLAVLFIYLKKKRKR